MNSDSNIDNKGLNNETNLVLNDAEIVLRASDIIAHPQEDYKMLKEGADEVLQIIQEGRKYKTRLTKKFSQRKKWVEPNPKEVRSIIPGLVASISVKAGDRVKAGDLLMVYEAMKMQNLIVAPADGVVKNVNVSVGDNLPKGAVLVTMR